MGVDIGASSVKACEVSKGVTGNYTLNSFAYEVLSEAAIIEDEIQKREEIKGVIKDLFKSLGTKSVGVSLGLSGQRTMTKCFEIPDGSTEEVEDNIIWESEQYISFGIENTEISHHILEKKDNGNLFILMAACNIDMAKDFISLLEGVSLKVRVVDLDVIALANVFKVSYKEKKDSPVMIVDLGAQSTKILLMYHEQPILTKEVPVGSVLATEEIQRGMEVPYFEAEDLKMGVATEGRIPEDVQNVIWRHNAAIIEEIKKTIDFYNSTSGHDKQIEEVLLTGGGSIAEGWTEKLTEETSLNIDFLDPFRKIKIGSQVNKGEVDFIARVGSVAIGLAMRGGEQ